MAKLTLTLIRAIKECSMDEPTLIAFIQSVDKKPDPISGLVSDLAWSDRAMSDGEHAEFAKPRRKYRTRALKVDA